MTTHIESAEQYFPIASFLFVVVVVVVVFSFFFFSKFFQEKKKEEEEFRAFCFQFNLVFVISIV